MKPDQVGACRASNIELNEPEATVTSGANHARNITVKNYDATHAARAPQAKMPFSPRGKPASTSPWAVNAPAAPVPTPPDEVFMSIFHKILDGYSEKIFRYSILWAVTYDGQVVGHGHGLDGWSTDADKRDVYAVICAITRLMGHGEYICEEFIRVMDCAVDHNLPSQAEQAENAARAAF